MKPKIFTLRCRKTIKRKRTYNLNFTRQNTKWHRNKKLVQKLITHKNLLRILRTYYNKTIKIRDLSSPNYKNLNNRVR